ncbi:MAG: FMN-binding protein [Oscillospiraceae bacterium]|nr:FMN-binding protein [Oscillospiraceae bacterium]
MSMKESRRDFLKKSSMLVGTAAVLGTSMIGCAQEPEVVIQEPEIPAYPYPCCEFDLDRVEKIGYEGYFENGCCYGVAKALLTELSEKVGAPFTYIPAEMFANGKEGYQAASLCGAMGGALGVFGLVLGPDDARALTKELNAWYTSTPLPIYQPEGPAPVQTVAGSINCLDSVSEFMTAAGVEKADPIRKRRCGGVTADVARKAAELLNIHFGFMAAPDVDEKPAEDQLAPNEYIGEADGFGGPVKVKVTMDGDKIAKIDVLSHGETAGVSDAAFNTVPQAIIAANSTAVDVAGGATVSSKAIMAAVENALSKVK